MTRQIEARLVDTLAAMADQITEQQLPDRSNTLMAQPHVVNVLDVRRTRSHSRWIAPLLAAASVAALAVGGLVVKTALNADHHDATNTGAPTVGPSRTPTPSTTPSAAPTTTPTTTATVLPLGKEGGVTDIPWTAVGHGWTLATWTSATNGFGPAVLYLVDPLGGRYRIADLPENSVVKDWSPDHRRALVQTEHIGDTHSTSMTEWSIATGQALHTFDPNPDAAVVGYTRPNGTAVMMANGDRIWRYSTDGTLQRTYPAGYQIGASALYTSDGLEFLATKGDHIVVLGNDGTLKSTLTSGSACVPLRWWSPGTEPAVLADCRTTAFTSQTQTDAAKGWDLFVMRLSGESGQLTDVAASPRTKAASVGGAWQSDVGIVVPTTAGLCGATTWNTVDNRVLTELPVREPSSLPKNFSVVSVFGANAMTIHGCLGTSHALAITDLKTGSVTVALGPGRNGGSVGLVVVPAAEDR